MSNDTSGLAACLRVQLYDDFPRRLPAELSPTSKKQRREAKEHCQQSRMLEKAVLMSPALRRYVCISQRRPKPLPYGARGVSVGQTYGYP